MTAYRQWTLTCEGCGRIFDNGQVYGLRELKAAANQSGWRTGKTKYDDDLCPLCQADPGGPRGQHVGTGHD